MSMNKGFGFLPVEQFSVQTQPVDQIMYHIYVAHSTYILNLSAEQT